MSRLLVAWLSCIAVCGCAHLGQQSADCPCDDCLPPAVAGKYSYANRLDNLLTACTAQKCAHRDLKDFDCACEDLGRDFRDGYTQAYIDLAAGRPACVPAVPPKKYWHAWHRSCGGRDAVEQWFAGYRTGLDRGVHSGVSRFNRIVPNFDSGCVSAAYVNPYAAPQTPTGILPADGQTITQLPLETESLDNRSAERGAAAPIMPVQSATFAE